MFSVLCQNIPTYSSSFPTFLLAFLLVFLLPGHLEVYEGGHGLLHVVVGDRGNSGLASPWEHTLVRVMQSGDIWDNVNITYSVQ